MGRANIILEMVISMKVGLKKDGLMVLEIILTQTALSTRGNGRMG
jgi:hypothetical protein